MSVERVAWTGTLHPDRVDEYARKHTEIWPEMAESLADVGIRNYSIFVHGNLAFGYYESSDAEASIRGQREAPIRPRWKAHMSGLFISDGTTRMREVMHLPGHPLS
ncbi:L-rhamnose mutarotase [Ilumatobacter fluminis]|uniref:L-rhamnose mutarotase n=1 Tax=Ilumatobacter fluminis TaxID=467091 RepID=A0A4R7HVM3_9ACTN|nr:L-rhamnose mutarotase [Ilumatobacter fluminis]TDT14900.1 L-rhamnose mutarotase [Ilumatobacter fluminis]